MDGPGDDRFRDTAAADAPGTPAVRGAPALYGDEVVAPSAGPAAMTEEDVPGRAPAWARGGKRRLRAILLSVGLVVLLAGGLFFYLRGGRYETTEDASLAAGQLGVAANVSGPVIAVAVRENQAVRAGDVLFRIDPAPYQAALDEAEARLADARAAVGARRASYRENQAGIDAARARLAYAEGEAARQGALLKQGISSQNQYDEARLAVATARQAIATSTEQVAGVRAQLGGSLDSPVDAQPAVRAAAAAVERARLNLGYTVVRAAQAGIVTRVNQLQPGSYLAAAKPAFTLVGARVWVEANFKESQLAHMRVGQRATVRVDAYPDRPIAAHVASFSPGTGNSFALLPAENATGNWVKVVQRLPVQLELDARPTDLPLHAGLSTEVTVDTGRVRHLLGPTTAAGR